MDDAALPPTVGGRYRPLRLIGRGGMGSVYEAEHVHTGERVALKILDRKAERPAGTPGSGATAVERFKREARASAQIRSDHVVRVTDADVAPELGGAPFVVMELLQGADLEQVAGHARQEPSTVVGWLRQVARALDKAHGLGIVHRDLKPANLFLARRDDGSGVVKILDFGIAKMLDGGVQTTTGELVGTPLFMAPEQARADVPPSGATDRYALGLIAYQLLCGQPYWRTTQIVQLLNEVLYLPMAPPSERESTFGPDFDAWFARSCAREPTARFASAAEQIEALAAALGVAPSTGDAVLPPDRTGPATSPNANALELAPTMQVSASSISGAVGTHSTASVSRWRRPGGIATIAAVVVAAGVALALSLRPTSPPSPSPAPAALPASAGLAPSSAPAFPPVTVAPPASVASAAAVTSAATASSSSASPGRPPPSPSRQRPTPPRPVPSLDPFGDQK